MKLQEWMTKMARVRQTVQMKIMSGKVNRRRTKIALVKFPGPASFNSAVVDTTSSIKSAYFSGSTVRSQEPPSSGWLLAKVRKQNCPD